MNYYQFLEALNLLYVKHFGRLNATPRECEENAEFKADLQELIEQYSGSEQPAGVEIAEAV